MRQRGDRVLVEGVGGSDFCCAAVGEDNGVFFFRDPTWLLAASETSFLVPCREQLLFICLGVVGAFPFS